MDTNKHFHLTKGQAVIVEGKHPEDYWQGIVYRDTAERGSIRHGEVMVAVVDADTNGSRRMWWVPLTNLSFRCEECSHLSMVYDPKRKTMECFNEDCHITHQFVSTEESA
jgi:hypothetical protein